MSMIKRYAQTKPSWYNDKNEFQHYCCMLEYAHHPSSIGLDNTLIEGYLIEPVWYHDSHHLNSLCDIIFLLYGDLAVPTEVKRSENKRDKALSQIIMGEQYCRNVLHRDVDKGVLAYYSTDTYETHIF